MLKNKDVMMCYKHIVFIFFLCVCLFIFNIIEFKMMNTNQKGYFLMMDISSGLQILGCSALGFYFGRTESVTEKKLGKRIDTVRLLVAVVCCIYALVPDFSWMASDFVLLKSIYPDALVQTASIIQQFVIVKLLSVSSMISFAFFEILYLLAKYSQKVSNN